MGQRNRGQSRFGLIIGILAVAAIGGGAWYCVAGASGPEKAVRTFITASANGDKEAAKAVLAKNSQALGGMPGLGRKADGKEQELPTVGDATINGDKATVPVTTKLPEAAAKAMGMTELTVNMATVKEDGAWKVDLLATAGEMAKGIGGMAGAMMKSGGK